MTISLLERVQSYSTLTLGMRCENWDEDESARGSSKLETSSTLLLSLIVILAYRNYTRYRDETVAPLAA